MGCSLGVVGKGDLRVMLELGTWAERLLTGTRGLIFCVKGEQ